MSVPHTCEERVLAFCTPEQRLVVALLSQALRDARHAPMRQAAGIPAKYQTWQAKENAAYTEARRWFLEHAEEVRWWLELVGLPAGVYTRLLQAAGLTGEGTDA